MFAEIVQRLAELPVSARVAFAYRCAQRVLPFLTLPPVIQCREEHKKVFERAIHWARVIAIRGSTFNLQRAEASELESFVDGVEATAKVYEEAARWVRLRQGAAALDVDLFRAVDAAFDSAALYLSAAECGYADQDYFLDNIAFEKYRLCLEACQCEDSMNRATELDQDWLARRIDRGGVPESFFARDLWPDGDPDNWLVMIKRAQNLMSNEHAWMTFLNQRRIFLINKDSEMHLNSDERGELEQLELQTSEYFDRLAPLPFDELEKLESLARRITTDQQAKP